MKQFIQALILVGVTGNASAHHGIANFDLNSDIELNGTVTNIRFINPHSWLFLDVTNANGEIQPWRCELRGATVLRRSGWSPEMFPDGIEINITGSPDRRKAETCYVSTITFADGSSINRYGQLVEAQPVEEISRAARLPNGDPNIAGDWASEQQVMTDPRGQKGTLVPLGVSDEFTPGDTPGGGPSFPGARGTTISLADDPVDSYWNQGPSALPLTEAGIEAIATFDGSSRDNPRLDCRATNIMFDWTFEMDVNQIIQTETSIRMLYGSMGLDRTIHLNQSEHPSNIVPSIAGHSIGRWENDVLIVDTVGFAPGIITADGRIPHSEQMHVLERFTLNPETMALSREYIADDPLYLLQEYKGGDVVYVADLPYHGTSVCEDDTQ